MKALSQLPEEAKARQLEGLNEAIEHEERQSEVPDGMSEREFRKLIQMRTDGEPEDKVQAALRKMRLEEVEEAKKGMSHAELQRMATLTAALRADRYKPDEHVAAQERALWAEFGAIKKRVAVRLPLLRAHAERQAELSREAQQVLDDPEAEADDKGRAVRKMLHDTLADLEEQCDADERGELSALHAMVQQGELEPEQTQRLERLLAEASHRRIEQAVDERLRRRDDVLV